MSQRLEPLVGQLKAHLEIKGYSMESPLAPLH